MIKEEVVDEMTVKEQHETVHEYQRRKNKGRHRELVNSIGVEVGNTRRGTETKHEGTTRDTANNMTLEPKHN